MAPFLDDTFAHLPNPKSIPEAFYNIEETHQAIVVISKMFEIMHIE